MCYKICSYNRYVLTTGVLTDIYNINYGKKFRYKENCSYNRCSYNRLLLYLQILTELADFSTTKSEEKTLVYYFNACEAVFKNVANN